MAKQPQDTKTNTEEESTTFKWEDLMSIRSDIVKQLMSNQTMLNTIVMSYKSLIDEDKELTEIVAGVFNSLTDIAKIIHDVTKTHATLDQDGKLVEYKKGDIDVDSEDYLDYNVSYQNYLQAGEQVGNIISLGYTEVVTKIAEKTESLTDEELAEFKKNVSLEQLKFSNKVQGALNGIFTKLSGEPKQPKPKRADRHKHLPKQQRKSSKPRTSKTTTTDTGTDNTNSTTDNTADTTGATSTTGQDTAEGQA